MLTLTSGESSVVVAPEYGAALLGWMRGGTSLLRRALPGAVGGDSHLMSCFPMLPYCNRVANARFTWDNRDYVLARNFGDRPHTIHGTGWQRAWSPVRVTAGSVVLALEHAPDPSWPFAFAAEVCYALTNTTLTITIRLTNRHNSAVPAGVGLHPYFPRAHDPKLRFNAHGVWENDADGLPERFDTVPPEWSHTVPLAIAQTRLDNCFTGWDGSADIAAGQASLRVDASGAFRHLQVFTPHWADFFCIEPVSHVPDAINRADGGMDVLEPGATLGGTIRLTSLRTAPVEHRLGVSDALLQERKRDVGARNDFDQTGAFGQTEAPCDRG